MGNFLSLHKPNILKNLQALIKKMHLELNKKIDDWNTENFSTQKTIINDLIIDHLKIIEDLTQIQCSSNSRIDQADFSKIQQYSIYMKNFSDQILIIENNTDFKRELENLSEMLKEILLFSKYIETRLDYDASKNQVRILRDLNNIC